MPETKRVGDCVTVVFDNYDLLDLLGPAAIKAAKGEMDRFEYAENSSVAAGGDLRVEIEVSFDLSVDRLAARQAARAERIAA